MRDPHEIKLMVDGSDVTMKIKGAPEIKFAYEEFREMTITFTRLLQALTRKRKSPTYRGAYTVSKEIN